jgi:hypothetical protein
MVRKKMEGDEDERRRAAQEARKAGEMPSERGSTTGASKQRTHLPGKDTHEERIASPHRGKQQWRPGEAAGQEVRDPGAREPVLDFTGRGRPPYSEEHETVYHALVEAMEEHDGEAVFLEEIARTAHRPREETRVLLHDLARVHHLVTELEGADSPDLGPRFETSPGR